MSHAIHNIIIYDKLSSEQENPGGIFSMGAILLNSILNLGMKFTDKDANMYSKHLQEIWNDILKTLFHN